MDGKLKVYRLTGAAGVALGLACSGHLGVAMGASEPQAAETAPVSAPEAETTANPSLNFDPSAKWTVQAEPQAWYPALLGEITFANGSTFEVKDIDMDENHLTPAGLITFRGGKWSFSFQGFGMSFDDEGRSDDNLDAGSFNIAAGETVKFDVDYSAFKLTAGYAFDPIVPEESNGTCVWLDVYGGVQIYHLDFKLTADDGQINENDTWVEPLVGGRLNIGLPAGFEVGCTLDTGAVFGDEIGFAIDVSPSFRWFVMGNKNFAVEIGYRFVKADLITGGDDPFEWDVSTAGLFGAVAIRF